MREQLKIVIFDGTFKTTPFINRLVKGLAANHEVYILGFNEVIQERIEGVCYIKLGSNSNKLSFIWTSLKIGFSSKSFKIIGNTLKQLLFFNKKAVKHQNLDIAVSQIKPDIIHAQWVSVLPWLHEILETQKIPVVLSQRGYHINVRPFVNSENMEYLRKWYPKIAGFHSVSKAISEKGELIYSSSKKIDKVVYTGLYLSRFQFKEVFKKSEKIVLISVGRAHWKKGYDYGLEACRILKSKGISFRYTIIGATNDEELLYLRKELNLEKEVVFLGHTPQNEVYQMVQNSDVMLLPSIEEGIANVCVEAMALGTPVISTNCGGMEELITHEKEGWIVPTRNPEVLANQIIEFTKLDLETIDEVRKNARIKVEQQFSEAQMVAGMEALYREVLDS